MRYGSSPTTCYTCADCSCPSQILNNTTICAGTDISLPNGSVIRNSTGFVVNASGTYGDTATWTLTETGNYTLNSCDAIIRVTNCSIPTPTPIPTPTVTATPTPTTFTYSVTNTNGAKDRITGRWTWNENSRLDIDSMTRYLSNANNWNNIQWSQVFSNEGSEVTKGNFGISPSAGEHTLNEATLHYHTGHGYWPDTADQTGLALVDSEYNDVSLYPDELQGRWGGSNKWVILSSCFSLRDDRWDDVFAYSHATHGILGFKTISYAHTNFVTTFFEYAKTKPVSAAFLATVRTLDRTTTVPSPTGGTERLTAVVIFSDNSQMDYDYLPGFGSGIQPDADNVDPVRDQWPLKEEGGA